MTTVVLGAFDPEMDMIEQVAWGAGFKTLHAAVGGRAVTYGDANRADGVVSGLVPTRGRLILVECRLPTPPRLEILVCDHHRPGDPGYGQPPAKFLEASSLGQFLSIVHGPLARQGDAWYAGEVRVTDEQVLVAAADHCLRSAYAGACPTVDPHELMRYRLRTKARKLMISQNTLAADIAETAKRLYSLPEIDFGDAGTVRWADYAIPHLPEASAISGIPVASVLTGTKTRKNNKVVFFGTPDQVRVFRARMKDFLVRPYGDPERGMAGGYLQTMKLKHVLLRKLRGK